VAQEIVAAGRTDFAGDARAVVSAGGLAQESGRDRMDAGDALADEGKAILIGTQEAGQWRSHRDSVTSSRPA
jgi:hypothetical protein